MTREDISSGSRDFWILFDDENISFSWAPHFVGGILDFNQASVSIINNNNQISLTYNGEGEFIGDSINTPVADSINTLLVELKNKIVSSETIVPIKPQNFEISATSIQVDNSGSGGMPNMSESIDLYWDNPNGEYYLLQIENIEVDPESIYEEERPTPPGRVLQEEGSTISPRQIQYYGTHRIILYHINDELAAIYEDQCNSSQNLTDLITNITNGYGIFTGINSGTLYLEITN